MKKVDAHRNAPHEAAPSGFRGRAARAERSTAETDIRLNLCLDGSGQVSVHTGFGLLDHMLTLTAFWANFDLTLNCQGDLHIDAHHTAEDVGLTLGRALREAVGDRQGLARAGWARVPMDEALADVAVDLSGRPWLEWRGDELLPPLLAGEEKDLWREYYKALASSARCNIHICFQYGKNGHHLLESAAKGLGLALAQATRQSCASARASVPSTKGSLD
ncbi:MAG: imidazoleglycerol-phosphate dehydratase [Desulfovibrionaceae bacterium]|nr:imidazoleglycerol-phosphate dehydratase [Desulfovibrionaceae bacterium]